MADDIIRRLDRVLEVLGDVRVDAGRTAERLDALAAQQSARDRELEQLARHHEDDMARVEAAIDELRARPSGLTGRQLLVGIVSVVAAATGLIELISRIRIG